MSPFCCNQSKWGRNPSCPGFLSNPSATKPQMSNKDFSSDTEIAKILTTEVPFLSSGLTLSFGAVFLITCPGCCTLILIIHLSPNVDDHSGGFLSSPSATTQSLRLWTWSEMLRLERHKIQYFCLQILSTVCCARKPQIFNLKGPSVINM